MFIAKKGGYYCIKYTYILTIISKDRYGIFVGREMKHYEKTGLSVHTMQGKSIEKSNTYPEMPKLFKSIIDSEYHWHTYEYSTSDTNLSIATVSYILLKKKTSKLSQMQ